MITCWNCFCLFLFPNGEGVTKKITEWNCLLGMEYLFHVINYVHLSEYVTWLQNMLKRTQFFHQDIKITAYCYCSFTTEKKARWQYYTNGECTTLSQYDDMNWMRVENVTFCTKCVSCIQFFSFSLSFTFLFWLVIILFHNSENFVLLKMFLKNHAFSCNSNIWLI